MFAKDDYMERRKFIQGSSVVAMMVMPWQAKAQGEPVAYTNVVDYVATGNITTGDSRE